jgi:hypothetical protein
MRPDPKHTGIPFPPTLAWSPLPSRPALTWPGDAPLAVCVVIHVEHAEWIAPDLEVVPPSLVRRPPYPRLLDSHEVSPHEYGNRVGFFRLHDIVRSFSLPAAVAIDATSALRYPPIIEAAKRAGFELVAHGISASRPLTGSVPLGAERNYIRRTLDTIEAASGARPSGWVGVEYSESANTPEALAAEGISYTLDWANDEQPFVLRSSAGDIVALPIALELDDIYSIHMRRILTASWAEMVREAADFLASGRPESARLLIINLHAWLAGQPFRARHVREILASFAGRSGIWAATPGEVDRYYRSQAAYAAATVGGATR